MKYSICGAVTCKPYNKEVENENRRQNERK